MKKINIIILMLVSSILFGFIFDQTPEHVKIAHKVRSKISEEIERKFNVKEVGTGGGMYKTINLLCLSFDCRKKVLKEDASSMLIAISQFFLEKINENEEIRPYLCNYPFGIDNVEIDIFFYDKNGGDLSDPYIASAVCSEGTMIYSTSDPKISNEILNKDYLETYEEAIKKLNKSL